MFTVHSSVLALPEPLTSKFAVAAEGTFWCFRSRRDRSKSQSLRHVFSDPQKVLLAPILGLAQRSHSHDSHKSTGSSAMALLLLGSNPHRRPKPHYYRNNEGRFGLFLSHISVVLFYPRLHADADWLDQLGSIRVHLGDESQCPSPQKSQPRKTPKFSYTTSS